jgi:hypothetical protein
MWTPGLCEASIFADMGAAEAFDLGVFSGCEAEFLVQLVWYRRKKTDGGFHSWPSATGYESPLGKSLTSLSVFPLL